MLASTSLAFMLVEVPAPPWYQSTRNWSWYLPSITASQAFSIAASFSGFMAPTSVLARAAASLTMAQASFGCGWDPRWLDCAPWRLPVARRSLGPVASSLLRGARPGQRQDECERRSPSATVRIARVACLLYGDAALMPRPHRTDV